MTTCIPALQAAIEALALPGISIDHRLIEQGDDQALLAGEREPFEASVMKVRRASGAARTVARELLRAFGHVSPVIPKAASGMPVWPAGVVGSLAHDFEVAVAAVAANRDFQSLGIDIEPEAPLDPDLLDLVATSRERQQIDFDLGRARLLFVIKEAVYKAVFPLTGEFLEHHDVEVNVATKTASVRGGRTVSFRHCAAGHFVAIAFVAR